jgi:hypothetical protein
LSLVLGQGGVEEALHLCCYLLLHLVHRCLLRRDHELQGRSVILKKRKKVSKET